MLPSILLFNKTTPRESIVHSDQTALSQPTRIQTISEYALELISCFCSCAGNRQDPQKVISMLPAKVQETLKELDQAQKGTRTDELHVLADKISELAQSYLKANRLIERESPESKQALQTFHSLARKLKEATPATAKIWQMLVPEVQQVFHQIIPWQEAPQADCLKLRWCHSTESMPSTPTVASFEDGAVFCLKNDADFVGLTKYRLQNYPGLTLLHTGPLPEYQPDVAHNLIQSLPKTLFETFDAASVLRKYHLNRLVQPIAAKYLHQLLTMRNAYFNMIADSLGIQTHRPLEIGSMGEWCIFPEEAMSFRRMDEIADWSKEPDLLAAAISALQNFINLEHALGLKLLELPGPEDDPASYPPTLPIAVGSKIVPGCPLNKIEFIEPESACRQPKLKSIVEQHLPPEVYQHLNWKTSPQECGSDFSCGFLRRLLDLGIIGHYDLRSDSESILALLQANYSAYQNNPSLYQHIPWENLKDEQSLKLYLQLVSIASQNLVSSDVLLEHCYCLAKKLILDIPKHLVSSSKAAPGAKLDYDNIVTTFLSDKSSLSKLVATYVLSSYSAESQMSFAEHFQLLLNADHPLASKKSVFALIAGRLNEEGNRNPALNPKEWVLWPDEKPCTPGEYFDLVFWRECVAHIQDIIDALPKGGLEDKLAILRTAYHVSGSLASKESIHQQMMQLLHQHMVNFITTQKTHSLKILLSA